VAKQQTRTKAEWAAIISAFKKSGLSQAEFCRDKGINVKTLGNHLRGSSVRPRGHRSDEDWLAMISAQQSSGLSQSAWCREHGIKPSSMTTAARRLATKNHEDTKTSWIELNLPTESVMPMERSERADYGIRIRCSNVEIEISSNYPDEKLVSLIGKLVSIC